MRQAELLENSSEPEAARPMSWIHGGDCQNAEVVSMQAIAISGTKRNPITVDRRIIGFSYEDNYARYCRLCNILPQNIEAKLEAVKTPE